MLGFHYNEKALKFSAPPDEIKVQVTSLFLFWLPLTRELDARNEQTEGEIVSHQNNAIVILVYYPSVTS
jgi:hypothetical protein